MNARRVVRVVADARRGGARRGAGLACAGRARIRGVAWRVFRAV